MNQSTCKDCKHFVQHFVCFDGRFIPCGVGHCVQVRLKIRKTTQKPCENFCK